ncbi:MAG: ABC transporter ATP-binding protein [Alphaproteobacteria bacterium]|nr:ABC transporter ATP-binding protein [Alphaproteobacteria bacterium]
MLDTHQKVKMLAIVSTIIVGVGVLSVISIYFGYMITQYESQNVVFISSMFLVTGYAVILMISYLIGEFRFYLLSQLDNDIFRQLIINSYLKILKKDFSFHQRNENGALWESLRQGADSISLILQSLMNGVFPFILQLILAAGALIYFTGLLGAIGVVITVGIFFVFSVYGGKNLRKIQINIIDAETKGAAKVIDGLSNIETVKLFHAEQAVAGTQALYMQQFHHHVKLYIKMRLIYKSVGFFILMIGFVWVLLSPYLYLGQEIYNSQIFITVSLYFIQIMTPLQQLHVQYLEIMENVIKFQNLQKYSKIEEENSQKITAQVILKSEQIESSILLKLENISLVYSERSILENVNLTIKRGDKICISGHSGSGKSSLCHILAGLVQPSSGKIFYNPSIKNNKAFAIAVVPQQVLLFNQSLAFNVALGFDESSISIRQALNLASLQSLLSRHPDIETIMLGDGGITLSGGERQRIGLARAFYRQPQILILDESTSNLDVVTEEAILETLQNYPADLTIILVTHKRKPITWINRYILVDKGKIVETLR